MTQIEIKLIWKGTNMHHQSKDDVNSPSAKMDVEKKIKIKINIFSLGDYQTKSVEKATSEGTLSLLIKQLCYELTKFQDRVYHIFISNSWNLKYHLHNSPVTQNSALAHNTATIVYADNGEQLKGLNELYQTILNDSKRIINLNVIPEEKKSLVKQQFKSLPTKFDWVKNYYLYTVSAYDVEKFHLGYYTTYTDKGVIVSDNQPLYLIVTKSHISWVFSDDLDSSESLRCLIKTLLVNHK